MPATVSSRLPGCAMPSRTHHTSMKHETSSIEQCNETQHVSRHGNRALRTNTYAHPSIEQF